jgi:hypothetical protein
VGNILTEKNYLKNKQIPWGRGGGGDIVGVHLTNVQCKAIQKCHNDSLPVLFMYANKNLKNEKQNKKPSQNLVRKTLPYRKLSK